VRPTDEGWYVLVDVVELERVLCTAGAVYRSSGPTSLTDVLERVLDEGVVIVGDIGVSILDIELLTVRVRLFIASADTVREMGVDWWESDGFFSSKARRLEQRRRAARTPGQPRVDGHRTPPS
jgi:hypothetical protein